MKTITVFILLLVTAGVITCVKKKGDALVMVDGSTLTLEEFQRYLPASEYKRLSDENLKAIFENWAEQQILYLEARKRGIDKEDSVKFVLEQYRKNFLAMELVRREFGTPTISELALREYFAEHQEEFLYAVKLGQIVLPTYEMAATTLAEIKAGADFFKIARERSLTRLENPDDPRIITEYLPRGRLGDFATEEIIFKMKTGEVSEIIPYLQGTFLIVKMVDKKKIKSRADFSEFRAQIHNYLVSRQYQEFLEKYVDSLKTKYKVTINLAQLKK